MKLSELAKLKQQSSRLKSKLGLRGNIEPGMLMQKAQSLIGASKNLNTITKDPVKKLAIKGLI